MNMFFLHFFCSGQRYLFRDGWEKQLYKYYQIIKSEQESTKMHLKCEEQRYWRELCRASKRASDCLLRFLKGRISFAKQLFAIKLRSIALMASLAFTLARSISIAFCCFTAHHRWMDRSVSAIRSACIQTTHARFLWNSTFHPTALPVCWMFASRAFVELKLNDVSEVASFSCII